MNDIENNGANNNDDILPEDEITENDAELQSTIVKYQAEINDLKDKLLRTAAEIENTRKRYEKMVEEAREYSVTNFARSLMGAMDNLYMAIKHKPSDHNDDELKNFIVGVELISSEIQNAFTSQNINQIMPQIGDKFNYNFHQAVSQIPTDEYEQGSIVNVMQSGYIIKDRLLRPAMVNIAIKQDA